MFGSGCEIFLRFPTGLKGIIVVSCDRATAANETHSDHKNVTRVICVSCASAMTVLSAWGLEARSPHLHYNLQRYTIIQGCPFSCTEPEQKSFELYSARVDVQCKYGRTITGRQRRSTGTLLAPPSFVPAWIQQRTRNCMVDSPRLAVRKTIIVLF